MSGAAWDTEAVKIGKNAHNGAGGPREKVIKSQSALNAAKRSGAAVATEKKYTTGNAATKPAVEGQRLTMVDRSDDVVPVKKVSKEVSDALKAARKAFVTADGKELTQKELATKASTAVANIIAIESGKATPDQKVLTALERALNTKLRGKNMGQPLHAPKAAPAAAAAKK
ncbi:multi protein bridging factor 1-domain-containing protein [Lasiosphaeria miniovina]|uniref:Multiprotein-bridging factor 1 n=1 Tax=Lasiosphaeria miniovina TaxID=1954250 RepID=A0AA40B6E0_9PEZI|nr:multi protein bridging factor 1-domain-containing protein [Lasiosphaeria miniovina]KAK0728545.1 multi protein bridging factor 1-domain-containing protein [Lasiosphaeria miniovina]